MVYTIEQGVEKWKTKELIKRLLVQDVKEIPEDEQKYLDGILALKASSKEA